MKSRVSHFLFKAVKIAGITTGALILLLFLLPYVFPGFVSTRIQQWARSSIKSELSFSSARLSFFRHFPALTLTLYDVKLKGSAPFEKETLVEADEIALGVDLRSVFSEVRIDKIFLTNAFINIQVDSAGQANYNIYKGGKDVNTASAPSDSTGASLKIRKIIIEKSKLMYNDRSVPMVIDARGVDYEGNGDLSMAVFDLHTHVEIDSMDFYYNRQAYFLSKKVNADLITKINTNSLAFVFEKNDLLINQLPVTFTGRFGFLKDGYDMDFQLASKESDLHDVVTAMPPNMLEWLNRTEVKGSGDIEASLTGKYIAASNIMPDLVLNLKIRDGYVSNAQAPEPVQHLFLDLRTRLPGLNPDSLTAMVDSVYFTIDKDYFSAILRVKGVKQPWISARINSEIDLAKWHRAFGFEPFEVKGRYDLHLQAEGKYTTRIIHHPGLRTETVDTVISSIPNFRFTSSLRDGYFKYADKPMAVSQISFKLDASCPDNDYKHTKLSLENLHANVLRSYIKGFFRWGTAGENSVQSGLETVFHLTDLRKAVPLDSTELSGDLAVHVQTSGQYLPERKLFPLTVADLRLNNGHIQTKYYPHPLENIQVSATVTNTGGTLKDLDVAITPISFQFEGQPFSLKADLQNFQDLKYNIVSRGTLDIGKIYKVFAIQEYDVSGQVETRLSLRGRQSDATAGRYDRLFNKGTMKVKDLVVRSELFPLPFHVNTGVFRFDQDKMWFDAFDGSYGKTRLSLNGWLSNVIGYLTDKRETLKGAFDLKSDYLLADEFMAFGGGGVGGATAAGGSGSSGMAAGSAAPARDSTGVVIVPGGLSVRLNAMVKKVRYNGMDIDSFRGSVTIDSGALHLDTTRFRLAGAGVEMNAVYKSLTAKKASFDYHIQAKDFDVQRAYREIKLFRDMATSASKAQGIISLDYQLSGRLDGNMHPVYPSLKGGGVLSVSKVKVKGLRLFSAVSQESKKDVNDPDLSKVEIKSVINNNIITLERTRMKVGAFKLRMEGQASFSGQLNLKFRVGLPPFGVIGIPLAITGTQENPKVRAGHGSKKDELSETEDKDEDGKVD